MKKAIISSLATVCGLLLFNQSALAQPVTVFSDDLASDSSLAQPPWYNLNNTSVASYNFAANTGVELLVTSGSTGKVNEMFAEFDTVSLSDGDYITLTANFEAPSGSEMASDTGGLLAGLYYNPTVNTANEQGSTSGSLGTGGTTADSQGYFGIMGYNTTAGTSTKFFARTPTGTANNELGYYSAMVSGNYSQFSTVYAASGNANLADSVDYTMQWTITDNGASGNAIAVTISQGATTLDNWTETDTLGAGGTGLYEEFNQLDVGNYGKKYAVDLNLTDASIVTDGAIVVPEPSAMALLSAGLGLIGLIRFRRR